MEPGELLKHATDEKRAGRLESALDFQEMHTRKRGKLWCS